MVVRRRETISLSRSLSSSGVRLVSIVPVEATEIEPVSSETSTTSESLSSDIPMAARCRVPSCLEISGLSESGRKHPAAATRDPSNNHGAIMQRRPRPEDGDQQVVGKFGIERNPALDIGLQPGLPLHDHQRTDAILRKIFGRHHDIVIDGFGVVRSEFHQGKVPAEPRKSPADFRLEQNNQRNRHVRHQRGEQPFHHFQPRPLRAPVKKNKQRDGHQHLHGARPAQELEQVIDQSRNNQDVQRCSEVQAREGSHGQCGCEHGRNFYGIAALAFGASRSLPRLSGCANVKLMALCKPKKSNSPRVPTLLSALSPWESCSHSCT